MQSLSITIQLYDLQAAGLAMESLPSLLLVLATLPVLCLTQTSHMQEEALPKPSIRAEPEPVILRGQPVTIVCRGPAWAELFRLVEKNRTSDYRDQRSKSQCGLQGTEARYCINAVNEFTAGSYWCHYLKGPRWSEPSEFLELKVAGTAEGVMPPRIGAGSQSVKSPGSMPRGMGERTGLPNRGGAADS
ncbi:leukocyte-associated immunoglobulin-like receptor 2 isoform X2 [Phyllostomus hastatus]|uniref:leukocyte-associated immunoglobulin-like receptor 2 isoform X2 n=1 Tax=Phyllostomus hastatus TaxID=9423 RepID=UPI001E682704|nr:leukocyte-associated immunoglobulin-like receptor 2 isoform X2 [Phyllostomus hastatus]